MRWFVEREKSSQSLDLFQTPRDETRGPRKNNNFCGVQINRRFVSLGEAAEEEIK